MAGYELTAGIGAIGTRAIRRSARGRRSERRYHLEYDEFNRERAARGIGNVRANPEEYLEMMRARSGGSEAERRVSADISGMLSPILRDTSPGGFMALSEAARQLRRKRGIVTGTQKSLGGGGSAAQTGTPASAAVSLAKNLLGV